MTAQNIVAAIFLVVLSIGVYVSINRYEPPVAVVEKVDLKTNDLAVWVERTACFGSCPIYVLHITGDGSLRFLGKRFTDVEGGIEDVVSENQLFQIATAIHNSRYFEYIESEECEELVTDVSSVIIWIRWRNEERRVERNLGCKKSKPDPVPRLAREIESIVNVDQWIGDAPARGLTSRGGT